MINEFEQRTQNSIVDATILDYDGRKVEANKEWIKRELLKQAGALAKNYEHLFENVNIELANAVKTFKLEN